MSALNMTRTTDEHLLDSVGPVGLRGNLEQRNSLVCDQVCGELCH